MGNSPSADLGGGSTHSSRDVRTANPEMEVKRSLASRAPTHNEYTELPASSKPHIYNVERVSCDDGRLDPAQDRDLPDRRRLCITWSCETDLGNMALAFHASEGRRNASISLSGVYTSEVDMPQQCYFSLL